MSDGNVQIKGQLLGAEAFAKLTDEARARIRDRVLRVLSDSADEVRDEARSGAPARSGKLREGVYARAWIQGDRVEARVAIRKKVYYGRFLELGFARQTVGVKEYIRNRKALRMTRKAYGRQWRKAARMGIINPRGLVKAHLREHEVKKQTFFDPPARRVSALVPDRIRAAVDAALAAQAASAVYDVPR